MIVVSVDPGKTTGVVARDGGQLRGHALIDCDDLTAARRDISLFIMDWYRATDGQVDVAVEDAQAPNAYHDGQRLLLHPRSMIHTAKIVGLVLGLWHDAIVVPPGGHGKGPQFTYPHELWGPHEGPAGTGKLRHCRSAWDVAGAAMKLESLPAGSPGGQGDHTATGRTG